MTADVYLMQPLPTNQGSFSKQADSMMSKFSMDSAWLGPLKCSVPHTPGSPACADCEGGPSEHRPPSQDQESAAPNLNTLYIPVIMFISVT